MKKSYITVFASLWFLFAPLVAHAQTINNLGAGRGSVVGADLFPSYQGANPAVRPTATQIAAYVYSLMSGACTASGAGVITCPGGSGVTSVTAGCGLTITPTTGAVVASAVVTARNNTGTTDTILGTDCGALVTENNAAPVAVGIAQAGTAGFAANTVFSVKNKGVGLVTITPTTSTIDVATVKQGQQLDFYSDGTNYIALPGRPTNVACADLTNAGALCSTAPGTGVAGAAALALSAAGGLTTTIASGTAALGTSAIGAGACGTATIVSAPGVATTDVIKPGFNGDPTATTGYLPTAMLSIVPYPTSGNVNFKQCNLTASSITPSALTLNWSVQR